MTTRMDGTQVPDGINLAEWAGSRVLGFLFHYALFGILSMQVYLYYLAFPKDPLRNKIFVYTTYCLELTQTFIVVQSAFHVYGSGYGNWAIFNNVELAFISIPIISGMVAFLAEIFYAYRISVLAQSYRWAAVIVLLATVQLGGAIWTAVVVKRGKLLTNLWHKSFFVAEGIWNGGSAVCDIIIAACMIYYINKRRSATLRSNRVALQRVVTLIIETGAVTAAIALLNVIIVLIPGHPPYFATPAEILAKVYSNSMLVVLNSRMKVGSEADFIGPENTFRDGGHREGMRTHPMQTLNHGVLITREHLVSNDDKSSITDGSTKVTVGIPAF